MKTLKELEEIILSKKFSRLPKKEIDDILFERKLLINNSFELDKANINKMREINKILWQRMNQLYAEVKKVKDDLDNKIKSGDSFYKDKGYIIEGNIIIEPFESIDVEPTIFDIVSLYINCTCSILTSEGDPMKSHSEELMTDINWDENLRFIEHDYICYATHCFFIDDHALSFKEMINLKPEDIWTQVKILL